MEFELGLKTIEVPKTAKEENFYSSIIVPLEFYLGGKWQKSDRIISLEQFKLLSDGEVHLFDDDDSGEIFARLARD